MKKYYFSLLFLFITLVGCQSIINSEKTCAIGKIVMLEKRIDSNILVLPMEMSSNSIKQIPINQKSSITGFRYKKGRIILAAEHLFYLKLSSNGLIKLDQNLNGWFLAPLFSPNSNQIVVSHWLGDNQSQLIIINLTTKSTEMLNKMEVGKTQIPLEWNENGIIYEENVNNITNYYLYDLLSKSIKNIEFQKKDILLSPHGNFVINKNAMGEITITNSKTKELIQETDFSTSARLLTWSPNDKCIAYVLNDLLFIYSIEEEHTISNYKISNDITSIIWE